MKYLLDTNTLITAKNDLYSFDSVPGFWNWLVIKNKSQEVFSIDRVKKELLKEKDQLCHWIELHGEPFFLKTDCSDTLKKLKEVNAYIAGGRWEPAAQSKFFSGADPFLIAHAMTGGFTVVTQEAHRPKSAKIQIPTVCKYFDVRAIQLREMTKELKMRLVMDGSGA